MKNATEHLFIYFFSLVSRFHIFPVYSFRVNVLGLKFIVLDAWKYEIHAITN